MRAWYSWPRGRGGRGSVVLTAARACDDGAAINNCMEAPTPELPSCFPRLSLLSLPISTQLAVLSPPRSSTSALVSLCSPSSQRQRCPLHGTLALPSLPAPAVAPACSSASSSSRVCSPASDLYSAPSCPLVLLGLSLSLSPGCTKNSLHLQFES